LCDVAHNGKAGEDFARGPVRDVGRNDTDNVERGIAAREVKGRATADAVYCNTVD
jgi:hypothetical protein